MLGSTQTRLATGSAALAVIAIVPIVLKPDAPAPAAPDPAKGSLTVQFAGDDDQGETMLVRGPGPAPDKVFHLRDEEGLRSATVTSTPDGCDGDSARAAFGAGANTDWCLSLTDVDAGYELTGTVKAEASELALTVRKRDARSTAWTLIALGMLAGLLSALAPKPLRDLVRSIVLWWQDKQARDAGVDGVTEWLKAAETSGVTKDERINAVHAVRTFGQDRLAAATGALTTALADVSGKGLDEAKLVAAARTKLGAAKVAMRDFYETTGKARDTHPLHTWVAAVSQLKEAADELADLEARCADIQGQPRVGASRAIAEAKTRLLAVEEPAGLPDLEKRLETARLRVDQAIAAGAGLSIVRVSSVGDQTRSERDHRSLGDVLVPLGMSGGTVAGWKGIAILLSGIVAVAILLFAAFGLMHAGYDSKPLFHSSADRFALFSAAVGSSAAGTVLGMVAWWSPSASADG